MLAIVAAAGCHADRRSGPSQSMSVAAEARPQESLKPPPGRPFEGTGGFCLQMHAPRARVLLGEPVVLLASLTNCSQQPRRVDDLLAPEYGFLQIWVRPPDRSETLYHPLIRRDARGKPLRTLAPQESLTAWVPIYFGREGWTLTSAGTYQVRAEYAIDSRRLVSSTVNLEVVTSNQAVDRRAAEILLTREAGLFLMTGRDDNAQGSKRMEALAGDLRESRLSWYGRLALGLAESRGGFDPSTKTFRQPRCNEASEAFSEAVPRVSDPLLAATAVMAWSRCLQQLGREAEVPHAVDSFFRSHPSAKGLPGVAEQLGATIKKR